MAKHPVPTGSWLQGFGWDQERFLGMAFPTRSKFDSAFSTTPIWLGTHSTGAAPRAAEAQQHTRRAQPSLLLFKAVFKSMISREIS